MTTKYDSDTDDVNWNSESQIRYRARRRGFQVMRTRGRESKRRAYCCTTTAPLRPLTALWPPVHPADQQQPTRQYTEAEIRQAMAARGVSR
jgi:hypothetical protein